MIIGDELGTNYLLSDAARIKYLETGNLSESIKHSKEVHKQWLKIFGGDINKYAKEHTLKGTELSVQYGLDRTLISVTTEKDIAIYFSNGGIIFEGKAANSKLIKGAVEGSTESELYIANFAKLKK